MKIKATKEEFNKLELKINLEVLSPTEENRKRKESAELHKLSSLNCSIQYQRSRNRWLKEGDAYSKYFHGFTNKRRKENEIQVLEVEGRMVKEVVGIKKTIHNHFKNIFAGRGVIRPDNMEFAKLEEIYKVGLTHEFSEEEVWVWFGIAKALKVQVRTESILVS